MRGIEQAAISAGRVTGLALMERAGRGVVEAIFAAWPDMAGAPGRAVVLCGPGNNGGDGYVIARLLAAAGWGVRVFALAPPVTADAAAMRARWLGEVAPLAALGDADLAGGPVLVDAVFGTGLQRDIGPEVRAPLERGLRCGCPLVAVDILSGICADSGRLRAGGGEPALRADLTVTFARPKLGHVLDEGGWRAGRLVVVPLDLGAELGALLRDDPRAVVAAVRPADLDKGQGHKFSHGHALVLSGGVGRGGAARLAARGALRIGAGLVTVGCPPAAVIENAARLDAVMLRPLADAAGLAAALEDRRITALCLGPGLGVGRAAGMLPAALGSGRACVLDADALTALAGDAGLFARLHRACVLTPHAGEFARLFPDLAERLAAPPATGPAFSKVDATRAAAARVGCTVLYKGADTVIADPSGACVVHAAVRDRAAPWLATAGSGDVLAGFIAGLLARGVAPLQAAGTAAWLHVDCARAFGPGLIAEDLPEMLPRVLAACQAGTAAGKPSSTPSA